jgi:leucyl-tRNA synthetase
MSKSRGNVIDPDEQVREYGADSVRAYLMFGYRWPEGGPWKADNIHGVVRWLNRVWILVLEPAGAAAVEPDPAGTRELIRKTHQAIQAVSEDLENFEFNTVVSELMELTNSIADAKQLGLAGSAEFNAAIETLLLLMAPVTPHIAEELWERMGKPYSIHTQPWPQHDPELAKDELITLVIQVNGKVRDRILVPAGISEAEARGRALASPVAQRHMQGKRVKDVIVVPGRLVNVVLDS